MRPGSRTPPAPTRAHLEARTLVEAFVLPGSDAEAVYREALERRSEHDVAPEDLLELARVLVEDLAWDPARVEDAIAQVARVATVVEPEGPPYAPGPAS